MISSEIFHFLIIVLSEPKLTDVRRQQLIHELYELLSRIDWLITTLLKISRLDAGTVQFKQEQVSLEVVLVVLTGFSIAQRDGLCNMYIS